MIFNELILKVSSRCNLNCQYCYVFNQGDDSYINEPAVLHDGLIDIIAYRIKEHCASHDLKEFTIIFHGGEPLFADKSFYDNFCRKVNDICDNVAIHYGIQTNGTLLSQEWINTLCKNQINIGVSLDGTPAATKYRIFRKSGESAHSSILKGLKLLEQNGLPLNILSVANTGIDPDSIYNYFKTLGVNYMDFLFPDITYDAPVDRKMQLWMTKMFDCWYADEDIDKPYVRFFDTIVGLLLGVERGSEVIGRRLNQTLCIKPNGHIELVDNMKICGNGFTNIGFDVRGNSFDSLCECEKVQQYYFAHKDKMLCAKCKACIIKNVCGGGSIAHRYSKANGFDNPSAYCDCLKYLIAHIQNRLFQDLPSVFTKKDVVFLKDCTDAKVSG